MPSKVTPDQRDAILRMLSQGHDRDTIAETVGVTPGQVSAIAAHVKMGTYSLGRYPISWTHFRQVPPPRSWANLTASLPT